MLPKLRHWKSRHQILIGVFDVELCIFFFKFSGPCVLRRYVIKYTNWMHIYFNITMYLPHFYYVFRRVMYHLQRGLIVFLLKTTFFLRLLSVLYAFYIPWRKSPEITALWNKHVVLSRKTHSHPWRWRTAHRNM